MSIANALLSVDESRAEGSRDSFLGALQKVPCDGFEGNFPHYILGQLTPAITELLKAAAGDAAPKDLEALAGFLGRAIACGFPEEINAQLMGLL
eukprot:15434850-Alexandrium_andersonii.AAC.1